MPKPTLNVIDRNRILHQYRKSSKRKRPKTSRKKYRRSRKKRGGGPLAPFIPTSLSNALDYMSYGSNSQYNVTHGYYDDGVNPDPTNQPIGKNIYLTE